MVMWSRWWRRPTTCCSRFGDCDYDEEGDYWDCGSYGEYPGDWYDPNVEILADPAFIAGVAKQAVTGDLLPMTTEADTSVSGYNAVVGARGRASSTSCTSRSCRPTADRAAAGTRSCASPTSDWTRTRP